MICPVVLCHKEHALHLLIIINNKPLKHTRARTQADGAGVIYITPTFPWRVLAEEPLPGYWGVMEH